MIGAIKWLLRIGWSVQSTEQAYSSGDLMVKQVWIKHMTSELRTVIFKPWF